MPLISMHQYDYPHSYEIGVWKTTEDESTLEQMCRNIQADKRLFDRIRTFKSKQRRIETFATYLILYAMTNYDGIYIDHNDDGSPFIEGLNISISHTKGYAAVIISKQLKVGIDIEYISNRVEKITNWFMRSDEYAKETVDLIVQWCAKETAYKYFSAIKPDFLDLHSYYDESSKLRGFFDIEETKNNDKIRIITSISTNFVLTYTIG